jgi:hypothetical protein
MPKEEIERIILSNLGFDGKRKRFTVDIIRAIDMIRDFDIHHTKPKFSNVYCKLVMPE